MKKDYLNNQISPSDKNGFYKYMEEVLKKMADQAQSLETEDYCEIMEFFGPKIQIWGNYFSIHNDRNREPANVLSRDIFSFCLTQIKKVIPQKHPVSTILRIMDAMYPYDILNVCRFGDDVVLVGSNIKSFINFLKDNNVFYVDPSTPAEKIKVFQFVFEEFLAQIDAFWMIRFFARCDITYKDSSGLLIWDENRFLSNVGNDVFILSQIKKFEKIENRASMINLLLEDPGVRASIKEKIEKYKEQFFR